VVFDEMRVPLSGAELPVDCWSVSFHQNYHLTSF